MLVAAHRRSFVALLVSVLGCTAALSSLPDAVAAQAVKAVNVATLSPELQKVRAAMDKYQDPVVAVHDGYFSSVACVEYLKGEKGSMEYAPGGMGVHFINLGLIGPALDPAKPQVLI